jgi:hypothetical protein
MKVLVNILGIILIPTGILCFLLGCIYPHLIFLGLFSPFISAMGFCMSHKGEE